MQLVSKPYNDLLLRTEQYAAQVRKLFGATANTILKQMPLSAFKLNDEGLFLFADNKKVQEMVEAELRRLNAAVYTAIRNGVEIEWNTANELADKLLTDNFSKEALQSPYFQAMLDRNTNAMEIFLQRKEGGLDLSQRVWNTTDQLKNEMELSLSASIGEGESASTISRRVRQYLNEPDKLFRRVRGDDGKLHLSKAAKAYHPGQGVYRSSAKNAMRLARTETNIAYRRADNERWQAMSFVLGQQINLSRSHPKPDICDTLAGRYPKDFLFDGWHPQCFCYAVPILASKDDFIKMQKAALEGKEYDLSGQQVRDVPDNFKQWLCDNQDRISNAANLPYFLRNNGSFDADGTFVLKSFMPLAEPKEMTLKQLADIRHANRTEAEIAQIKQMWAERKHKHELIRKTADNVLTVAKDYGEVDYSALQEIINQNNLTKMQEATRALARQIAEIKKQEALLADLIPDVHTWHKQFTLAELNSAHGEIKKKIDWLAKHFSLDDQIKKLDFEANVYFANNMYGIQQTIKTWQVAQSAYRYKLSELQYAKGVQQANAKIAEIKAWAATSKSKKVPILLNEVEQAINAKADLTVIQTKLDAAEIEYQKRLAEQARRDKKGALQATKFKADDYSQARKDKAKWCITPQTADKEFHHQAVEYWKVATKEEKEALWGYTGGSGYITEPLRAISGHYYYYFGRADETERHIKAMTQALQKCKFKKDYWIKRDDASWCIEYAFNIPNLNAYKTDPSKLVGMIGTDGSFMSCGSCKNTYFTATGRKDVVYNIYCPKGTKGLYVQPFSSCGTYGRGWDGISASNPTVRSENEIILQRGTKMRITKAEWNAADGKWYIDVEVLEQVPQDFEIVKTASGYYCKFK